MVVIKKERYSCEKLGELMETLHKQVFNKPLMLDNPTEEGYDLLIFKNDNWTQLDKGNGDKILKSTSPCGTRHYYKWERDIVIIDVKELDNIINDK